MRWLFKGANDNLGKGELVETNFSKVGKFCTQQFLWIVMLFGYRNLLITEEI